MRRHREFTGIASGLLAFASLVVALAGCGARTGHETADGGERRRDRGVGKLDGQPRTDRGSDSGPSGFCQGVPKAELNGTLRKVTRVAGEPVAMGCCDGSAIRFEIDVDGQTHTLYAALRVAGGGPPVFPAQVDLANLPSGWAGMVAYSRCLSGTPNCAVAATLSSEGEDRFSGWARIEGKSFYDYEGTVSICLTAERAPPSGGNPPPQILRSVRLFAQRVRVWPIP